VADVPLVVRVTQFEKPSSRGLKKEHRLREFENRVLRIIERKGEEVTGRWRNFRKQRLHNFYSSANVYYYGDESK
jgi:Ser/Thr protein kinase RdoA (MazF antagonist)